MAEPWERQTNEGAKQFRAFCIYRDLPTRQRSHNRVAREYFDLTEETLRPLSPEDIRRKLSTANRQIDRWASKWRWTERVKAWEDELDRINRQDQIQAMRAMNERHISIGVALQTRAVEKLGKMSLDDMEAYDVRLFAVDGIKIERLARGEPESITKVEGDAPPSGIISARELIDIIHAVKEEEPDERKRYQGHKRAKPTPTPGPTADGPVLGGDDATRAPDGEESRGA